MLVNPVFVNRQELYLGQDAYLQILNGQAAGPGTILLRGVLWFVSQFYRIVIAIRNALFDSGLRKRHRVALPVISIGNITTGGTGKTPFVAFVAESLQSSGRRPGIISRGYGADASGQNDEKRVLDRLTPGVPHLQNPSRIRSACALIESGSVDCLIMDDGFQHRALERDLDVVLIDACNPFGYDELLPRGLLREPLNGLQRAHVVLITRCDLVTDDELRVIEDRICRAVGPDRAKVFRTQFIPVRMISADGRVRPLSEAVGSSCWLMSGIGNPAAFEATCRLAGLRVLGQTAFKDHHLYSAAELESVLGSARTHSAEIVVTTLKDLVKIPDSLVNIWAIDIRPVFVNSEDEFTFRNLIQETVEKKLSETDCSGP